MSRLTEFQIRAMIRSLKVTIEAKAAQGDLNAVRRSRQKLDAYVKELQERSGTEQE